MSNKKNYVPRNNADFNNWFRNMTQYVAQKTSGSAPEWDHILKREQDALNAAYADWYTHYAPTLKPHTSDLTGARNEARGRAEKVIRQVQGRFKVFGASGKAKPAEYNCVVAYEVRDASEPPPQRPEDLKRRVNAGRTPVTTTFDETERGKKVYMAMAWQNDRKIVGTWSAIQWTFVP